VEFNRLEFSAQTVLTTEEQTVKVCHCEASLIGNNVLTSRPTHTASIILGRRETPNISLQLARLEPRCTGMHLMLQQAISF
jgi:hypothetical protein